jgi:hypothetical protein
VGFLSLLQHFTNILLYCIIVLGQVEHFQSNQPAAHISYEAHICISLSLIVYHSINHIIVCLFLLLLLLMLSMHHYHHHIYICLAYILLRLSGTYSQTVCSFLHFEAFCCRISVVTQCRSYTILCFGTVCLVEMIIIISSFHQ